MTDHNGKMINRISKNELAAMKKLNILKPIIKNDIFEVETSWCRVAYNGVDKWYFKEHKHSFYELQFGLTGSCDFLLDGKDSFTVVPNSFLLIPPKRHHKLCRVSKDFSKLVFGFSIKIKDDGQGDFYKYMLKEAENVKLHEATKLMNSIVTVMLENALMTKQDYFTVINSQLTCLIVEFSRQIAPNFKSIPRKAQTFKDDERVKNAQKFIEDNISMNLTCADVARQANMSTKQLNRILKDSLDMSASDIIKNLQMKNVRKLLETTDITIEEIANKTSFSSEYALSRAFKRLEGMPPGKYRRTFKT